MSTRFGSSVLLSAAILSVWCSAEVAAQPSRVDWQAPASCPDQDAFIERLDAAVGSLSGFEGLSWAVDVQVSEGESGAFLTSIRMHIEGEDSSREVETANCGDALDTAVLVVALALSQSAEPEPEPEPEPDTAIPTPPRPRPRSSDRRRGIRTTPPPHGPRAWVDLEAGTSWGPMPALASAGAVRVELSDEYWRIGLGVSSLPHGAVRFSNAAGGVELSSVSLAPRGCLQTRLDIAVLGACASIDVGVLVARGSQLAAATTEVLPHLIGSLSGLAGVLIDEWVRLELVVGLGATPTRPRLLVSGFVVHQAEPVEVRAVFGVGFRLDGGPSQ